MYRHAFDAAAETAGQTPHLRHGVRKAAAIQILVRHGEHGLAGPRAERGDAVGLTGVEEVQAAEVQLGGEPRAVVSLQIHGNAGAAVPSLDGLVGCGNDGLPECVHRRTGGVVLACGHLETHANGNVVA